MSFPRTLSVRQELDDDPRYRGSIHDDAVARAQGYPAALVPGAFIYGHVSRLALQAWGPDWLAQGSMATRFRRPVFNGDELLVAAGDLATVDGSRRAEVSVTNAAGDVVASGWVAMPEGRAEAPPSVEHMPASVPVREIAAGELAEGMPLAGAPRVLKIDEVRRSRQSFGETDTVYARDNVVHPGLLMRQAMFDANRCFRFPAPVVLTEAEATHHSVVRPGQTIATRGAVEATWERNGRHYVRTREHMTADDRVAATFRRTMIYA